MTPESTAAAVPAPAEAAPPGPVPLSRSSGRVGRWLFGLTCLALVAGNLWWLARDLWPVPELAEINRLMGRGKAADAESALRARLARHPLDGEARILLARLLAKRGAAGECADELRRVPRWWPDRRQASYMEGEAAITVNRARQAEAAWWDCARDDPLHPAPPDLVNGAIKRLVALYVLEGRPEPARAVIWQAYRQARPTEKPAILDYRLRVEIERIEAGEAVAVLRTYVAADPADRDARRALALAEQAAGDPAEADRQVARCLADDPLDVASWRVQHSLLNDRNDPAALIAAAAALPAAVASAEDPVLQRLRARAFEEAGDLSAALTALRAAETLDPADAEVQFRLARVEQRLGQSESAAGHRDRHQTLLRAREALPAARAKFQALAASRPPDDPDRRAATDNLAALCDTLGWPQLAGALRELSGRPPVPPM